jgi:hypothetical protein
LALENGMTEAAASPLKRAQTLAEWASTGAIVAAVVISIGAVTNEIIAPGLGLVREAQVTPDLAGVLLVLRTILAHSLLAAPSLLLAWALLDLGAVADEYSKGQFFTLKASAGVRKAGEGALWALAFKIVISPTVFSWITHEGRGFIWHFETFDLGLVVFAAFVMVLGRVLEAAARIKAENDEIV